MESALTEAIPSSDRGPFERCIAEKRYAARVQADVSEGKRLGVTGTPEFFVGYFDARHPDELTHLRRLSGTAPIDDFEAAIESVLAEAGLKEMGEGVASQKAGGNLIRKSGFVLFTGQPVPVVRVDDLTRVWSFLDQFIRDTRSQEGMAVNQSLLADLCEPNVNVLAVYFRAILVNHLAQQGRLDRWREKNGLRHSVFELAARFPLFEVPRDADLDAFVAALAEAKPE